MPTLPSDNLLNLAQVADTLAVSETTVRAMIRAGKLPKGRKVHGDAVRWFRSDIEGYLFRLRSEEPVEPDEGGEG